MNLIKLPRFQKLPIFFFAIILLCLFIFFFKFAASQEAGFSKDRQNYAALLQTASIESDFIIERQSKVSDKPIVSGGVFIFERPDKLKWEYKKPFESGFLIDGEKVIFWRTDGGKIKTRDLSGNKKAKEFAQIMLMFISANMEEIEKTYIVEILKDGLLLTSRPDTAKSFIKSATIKMDEKMSAVKEVVILSQKDEKTLIAFSNLKINKELPPDAFKI